MKQLLKTFFTLALTLCLVGGVCVNATQYSWQEGQIPEGWSHITEESQIAATDILTPVNPNASQEAKNLYAYLCNLADSDQFLAGQFDMTTSNAVYDQLKEETGMSPAFYSNRYEVSVPANAGNVDTNLTNPNDAIFDPSKGGFSLAEDGETVIYPENMMAFTNVDQANALLKEHYDKGEVVMVHSDSAPRTMCPAVAVLKGKYEDATDCIVELDKTNPDRDMQTYEVWRIYQQRVIDSLTKLEQSGVKAYLWRPWIEYNGWAFTDQSPRARESFVRVYQQTVQDLVDAGLTGFLVTYSPRGTKGNTIETYPGNAYIDVCGFTWYSKEHEIGHLSMKNLEFYEWMALTGKPVGFTETSVRSGDWRSTTSARGSCLDLVKDITSMYPRVAFANFWGDGRYSSIDNPAMPSGGNDDGRLYLDNPHTLNADEILDYQNTVVAAPGVAQVQTAASQPGTFFALEERVYSAAELKAMGIDLATVHNLRTNSGYSITFYAEDNASGAEMGYVGANSNISADMAASFRSCKVAALRNVVLDSGDIYASDNDGDAWKVADGNPSSWQGVTDADGTAWVMFDMGRPFSVSRYVVKMAGSAGIDVQYNLRDFQLQYSDDGITWKTASTVVENRQSSVERSIPPVTARYFRLFITGANSALFESEKNQVIVSEIELYGVEAAAPADTALETEQPVFTPTEDSADTDASDEDEQPADEDEDGEEDKKPTRKPVKNTQVITVFPWWAWLLVALGVLVVGGGVTVVILVIKKKRSAQ